MDLTRTKLHFSKRTLPTTGKILTLHNPTLKDLNYPFKIFLLKEEDVLTGLGGTGGSILYRGLNLSASIIGSLNSTGSCFTGTGISLSARQQEARLYQDGHLLLSVPKRVNLFI